VDRIDLKENEQKVLYGLVAYPNLNDSQLSKEISIKLSTLTSVKRRLQQQNLFMQKKIPLLNKLGSEMLAVIHSEFNPIIPLKKRIEKAKESIEIYDEIFYSIGAQEKGFSISISKNYTDLSKINDIRRELFGKLGLLEKEYPTEIIFPYQTSDIVRFFQFTRLIDALYQMGFENNKTDDSWFQNHETIELNKKEKRVFATIINHPYATTQTIGEIIRDITIPNLSLLGFEILAFYHFQFNPGKYPSIHDIDQIDTSSTIFLARKKYEAVLISAYPSYMDYKQDKMNKIKFLKENDFISYTPFVRKYMFDQMESIKEFDFAPITRKILKMPSENPPL